MALLATSPSIRLVPRTPLDDEAIFRISLTWSNVTATYVEAMVGILVTVVGFLIVAIVFVYEQQRRNWRLSLDIDDGYRGWLAWHVVLTLLLVIAALLFALRSVVGIDESDLPSKLAVWATALGFGGLAHGSASLLISVRMLTPSHLADRIVQTPQGPRLGDPAQRLMDLAIVEHREDDPTQYVERLSALGRLGTRGLDTDRSLARNAFRTLLDIAIRIGPLRDPVRSALKECSNILEESGNRSRERGHGIAFDEPKKVAGKLQAVLANNLDLPHPSASVVKDVLALASDPELELPEDEVHRIFRDAIRATITKAHPDDLWDAVSESVLACERLTAVPLLLEVLDEPQFADHSPIEVRTGVERVELLVGQLRDPRAGVFHGPQMIQVEVRLLQLLVNNHEPEARTGSTRAKRSYDAVEWRLTRRIAERGSQLNQKDLRECITRIEELREPYQMTVRFLVELTRAQRTAKNGGSSRDRLKAVSKNLRTEVSSAHRAIEDVLGIVGEPRRKISATAEANHETSPWLDGTIPGHFRYLLRENKDLEGFEALPLFITARQMALRIKRVMDGTDIGAEAWATKHDSQVLRDLEEQLAQDGPIARSFSSGLEGCYEQCEEALGNCRSDVPKVRNEDGSSGRAQLIPFVQVALVLSTALTVHRVGPEEATVTDSGSDALKALKAFARKMAWLVSNAEVRRELTTAFGMTPSLRRQFLLDLGMVAANARRLHKLDDAPSGSQNGGQLHELKTSLQYAEEIVGPAGSDDSREKKAREDVRFVIAQGASNDEGVAEGIARVAEPSGEKQGRLDAALVSEDVLKQLAVRLRVARASESGTVDLLTWLLDPVPAGRPVTDAYLGVIDALQDSRDPSSAIGVALGELHDDLEQLGGSETTDASQGGVLPKPPQDAVDAHMCIERFVRWSRAKYRALNQDAIAHEVRKGGERFLPHALAILLRNGVELSDQHLLGTTPDYLDDRIGVARDLLKPVATDTGKWIQLAHRDWTPTNPQRITFLGIPRVESGAKDVSEYRSLTLAALHAVALVILSRGGGSTTLKDEDQHRKQFDAWTDALPDVQTRLLRNAVERSTGYLA